MVKKKQMGDVLIEAGFITRKQLSKALETQKGTDKRLGEVLQEMGLISEEDLAEALEYQLGIPRINLKKFVIDSEVIQLISQSLAKRHHAIPIKQEGNQLTVAMSDPLDVMAIDDIRIKTGQEVVPVIATKSEIKQAIDQYFGENEVVKEMNSNSNFTSEQGQKAEVDRLREMVDEAPIVKLVNNIITEGVELRASDIHIEPEEEEVRVRYRVDGILHNEMNIPKHTHSALVSRIKIMADLDIAERRLPQDGRVQMTVKDKQIDLRVSTLPTVRGEKVVLRILDKSSLMLDLKKLGFLSEHLASFKKMIEEPHGMILMTGPTGSGKTTTLYSALKALDTAETNIVTVEDPVEYKLAGINQVQVNPKAGLTFANGLRSILRQDPDIMMIGEIRDKETAEIAIHAALTGHLVLTTLHTNQAAGALTRLIDMGVEPFLVASSVIGVVAQRLVRTICQECKMKRDNAQIKNKLKDYLQVNEDDLNIYTGQGCSVCNDTGYRGRTAIHEILEVDKKIKDLVVEEASTSRIDEAARKQEMVSLEKCGMRKVGHGITTLEEAMRVTKVQVNQANLQDI